MQSQRPAVTGQWPFKSVVSRHSRGCRERVDTHNGQGERISDCLDDVARPSRDEVTFASVTPSLALLKFVIAFTVRATISRSGAVVVFATTQALGVIVAPATPPYDVEEHHAHR